MAITPNTTFVTGTVLTATTNMNRLPFGVVGSQTLTTNFPTVATHTTFQDNGMTLTFTEIIGRIYRITAYSNIYPSGGLQGINMRILRGATSIKQANYATDVLNAATALPVALTFVYTSTASGSATHKVQIQAATNNTVVNDFGDATFPRQFVIEDIGLS